MKAWRLCLLTVGGLGLVRWAPGTIGSVPPVLLALILAGHGSPVAINVTLIVVAIAFALVCVTLCPFGERHFRRKDSGAIVADEVSGMCIALLFFPWRDASAPDAWIWNTSITLICFAAFRLFDIWKPPPIRWIQEWPGGWGVVADDLLAGFYSLALAQMAARWLLPVLL